MSLYLFSLFVSFYVTLRIFVSKSCISTSLFGLLSTVAKDNPSHNLNIVFTLIVRLSFSFLDYSSYMEVFFSFSQLVVDCYFFQRPLSWLCLLTSLS